MHSNKKGSIIEIEIQLKMMKHGFSVFTPISDGSQIDFIAVSQNGKTFKVQAKSCKKTKVGFKVDVRRCLSVHRATKTNYDANMIDLFAFLFEDEVYLIPYDKAIEKNSQFSVRLTKKYPNNDCLDGSKYLLK